MSLALTSKRIVALSSLSLLFTVVELINWIFIVLDNIFYPGWKKTIIREPVFIVGMPRTGSSFLHHLLYSDKEKFTSMKLWEMLFCPSVIQKKIARRIFSSTGFGTSAFAGKMRALDKSIFKGHLQLHPTGLFEIEEDDFLLMPILASQTYIFMFPRIKWFTSIVRFDDEISEHRKKRIMGFWRKGIQKHLMVFGEGRTYLSKSPIHTPKMLSIRKEFPDCRFIGLIRDPEQMIPSTISLLIMLTRLYHNPVNIARTRERSLEMADHWYRYLLERLDLEDRHFCILASYEQLALDPDLLVRKIYHQFGYTINCDFSDRLSDAKQANFNYKSTHSYTLAEFGLHSHSLKTRYGTIYRKLLKFTQDDYRPDKTIPLPLVQDG